jgi:hypothetical protein
MSCRDVGASAEEAPDQRRQLRSSVADLLAAELAAGRPRIPLMLRRFGRSSPMSADAMEAIALKRGVSQLPEPKSCVSGAQALNRHTGATVTQDVDIMAEAPETFAVEPCVISGSVSRMRWPRVQVKRSEITLGYRVYQSRSAERGGNCYLADIRALDVPREHLAEHEGVRYTDAPLTMAMRAATAAARSNQAKRLQDSADLAQLMIAHPEVTAEELTLCGSGLRQVRRG